MCHAHFWDGKWIESFEVEQAVVVDCEERCEKEFVCEYPGENFTGGKYSDSDQRPG